MVKWQTHEIVGYYCDFIFFGKQYCSSQMKNNPESGEFCCLHICLLNDGKSISFSDDLDVPASSFSVDTLPQYINELYPNRILRVNFSEIQFAFETAEIEMVRLSYC